MDKHRAWHTEEHNVTVIVAVLGVPFPFQDRNFSEICQWQHSCACQIRKKKDKLSYDEAFIPTDKSIKRSALWLTKRNAENKSRETSLASKPSSREAWSSFTNFKNALQVPNYILKPKWASGNKFLKFKKQISRLPSSHSQTFWVGLVISVMDIGLYSLGELIAEDLLDRCNVCYTPASKIFFN